MAGYNRPEGGWTYTFDGINTVEAPDHLNPTQYPLAVNIRGLAERSVRTRPGYSSYSSYPAPLIITASCPIDPLSINVPYTTTLTATGGVAPYTWTITSGSLPTGLTLASNGVISGTPTVLGTFNWTATVTDSLDTSTPLVCSTEVDAPPLAITACPSDDPIRGVLYSFTLEATGGTAPYSWLITSGSLPTGLTLNPTTGEISGTPSANGTFNWTATVTDFNSSTAHIDCGSTILADVIIRPTTFTVVAGSRGVITNPENAVANDDSIAANFTINGGTGLSSFSMEFLQDFIPLVNTTGLDHVTFYMTMEYFQGNPANGDGPTLYGEAFDGIDTNDVHHPGLGACFTSDDPTHPADIPQTVYVSAPISAATYNAVADLTFRFFLKQQFGSFFSPLPGMNISKTWAVLHFS